MPNEKLVTTHYTHGGLLAAIEDGVTKLEKNLTDVTIDDLGPVDEFHVGGRVATQRFLDQLKIDANHKVLDVGCGLGGASRFAAYTYGCSVTGVDLTQEYVETGNELNAWVKLDQRIDLKVANATELPFSNDEFDRAYMLHVGMNIPDKQSLASELHRVVRPGSKVGIYDIMRINDGDLQFPVPWASESTGSTLSTAEQYKDALIKAGFNIIAEQNRRDFALEFLEQLRLKGVSSGGPPPLGLHILMGAEARTKIGNMTDNITQGYIAPVEIVAQKAP